MHLNVEIKARCANPENLRKILKEKNARFVGLDHQVDTYFIVKKGRLKLREGNIENSLIFYERPNQAGPKNSEVHLCKCGPDPNLKSVLSASLGVFKIVDKKREIYFIENVKFHIDEVKTLGHFVEIEAIDKHGNIGREKLNQQCEFYLNLFEIKGGDLVKVSYSDMV